MPNGYGGPYESASHEALAVKVAKDVVNEVFDALDNEPGFLHYPATNEEWNALRRKLVRRISERKRLG